jgi:hypothetical protein
MRGKPNADVRHQGGAARRPTFNDVNYVASVKHREMRVFAHRVSETCDEVSSHQCQRFLANVSRPEVVSANPESPTPIPVHDISVIEKRGEQVVRG